MKILVTGFDPFGGESINPAIESVKLLPDEIDGVQIVKLEIPTVIDKSLQKIKEAVDQHRPDAVLSVGQAGGRTEVTVERVGINVNDCRIPDNEGNQPIDTPIVEGGPAGYLLTLPIKAMVKACEDAQVPASVSNTAGTFICNHVAYGVAHLAATQYPKMRTGFVHIPFLPQQVVNKKGVASMQLDLIVEGLVACLKAIIHTDQDIVKTGGAEH